MSRIIKKSNNKSNKPTNTISIFGIETSDLGTKQMYEKLDGIIENLSELTDSFFQNICKLLVSKDVYDKIENIDENTKNLFVSNIKQCFLKYKTNPKNKMVLNAYVKKLNELLKDETIPYFFSELYRAIITIINNESADSILNRNQNAEEQEEVLSTFDFVLKTFLSFNVFGVNTNILPVKEFGISSFFNTASEIGQFIETGRFLAEPNELREIYTNGLIHFFKNLKGTTFSKFKDMSDGDKMLIIFQENKNESIMFYKFILESMVDYKKDENDEKLLIDKKIERFLSMSGTTMKFINDLVNENVKIERINIDGKNVSINGEKISVGDISKLLDIFFFDISMTQKIYSSVRTDKSTKTFTSSLSASAENNSNDINDYSSYFDKICGKKEDYKVLRDLYLNALSYFYKHIIGDFEKFRYKEGLNKFKIMLEKDMKSTFGLIRFVINNLMNFNLPMDDEIDKMIDEFKGISKETLDFLDNAVNEIVKINKFEIVDRGIVFNEFFHISSKEVKLIVDLFVTGTNMYNLNKMVIPIYDFDKVQNYNNDSNFRLFWYQKKAVNFVKFLTSFILTGPTSGGKTFISMIIMAMIIYIIRQNIENGKKNDEKLVYCSPTDQLAFQTYSNMIISFSKISDKIAIITKSYIHIPSNYYIIIGTPKELRDFFIQRDASILQKHIPDEQPDQKIIEYLSNSRNKPIYSLIVDEVHTMSQEYKNDASDKSPKAISDLISYLRTSEIKHFIGLSATLPGNSSEILKQEVSNLCGISQIESIVYNVSDVGKYNEEDRSNIFEIPQTVYNVCYDEELNEISKVGNDNISIDTKFIEALFFEIKLSKYTPSVFFFDDETSAIKNLKMIVSYIQINIKQSLWPEMRSRFIDRKEDYTLIMGEIQSNINRLFSTPYNNTKIPPKIFKSLLDEYKQYNAVPAVINYSPDLYAFLYEFISHKNTKSIFNSSVHPFYNFGEISKKDTLKISEAIKDTDFCNLLKAQNIDFDDIKLKSLTSLLIDGLSYGIGLITSSIPVGFQLEVLKLLRKIKTSKNGISFVFSDYQMSMGIDCPFNSTCIIQNRIRPLNNSSFRQMSGRSGRTNSKGEYSKSVTYLVNVSQIDQEIELYFNNDNMITDYYQPKEVFQIIVSIVDLFNKYNSSKNILLLRTQDSDKFIQESIFPGVDSIANIADKFNLMMQQTRELYNIFRVISPEIAKNYLMPMFFYFQKCTYENIMITSV
jgi:hypothetical protein